MDPDTEVDVDLSPYLIRYKSGCLRRLLSSRRVEAGTDATTGFTSRDVAIDATTGLTVRLFVPSDVLGTPHRHPLLVYFHGGGFAVHSAFSASPPPMTTPGPWRRPARRGPAGRRKSRACCPKHGDVARLFVAGDSSGANMAHHVALRAGRDGLPGGTRIERMALLHPYFDGKEVVASKGRDPRSFERQWVERWWAFVCEGRYGLDHPLIDPLAMPAAEWALLDCRRVMVTVAELDRVRDRGRMYVEAPRGSVWAGEEAVLYETHGEGHVFFLRKTEGRDEAKDGRRT